MKKYRIMSAKITVCCTILLLSSHLVMAQWAGEDKKIARKSDNTQQVTIGVQDPNESNTCYNWTGPGILSDPSKSVITVNPTDSINVYNVTRVSKYGVEEDQVIVRLIDHIEIVSVIPKFGCYSANDPIKLTEFDIVTEPPGYENLVTFSPNVAQNMFGTATGSQTITFTLDYNNHTDSKNVEITVVNENLSSTSSESYSLTKIKDLVENCSKLKDILSDAAAAAKALGKISPCGWDMNVDITIPSVEYRTYCCEHEKSPGLLISIGSLSPSVSYSCRFPFAGIPYIASADVVLGISAGITVNPATLKIIPAASCSDFSVSASLALSGNGGVGVSLAKGDVLSADLGISIGASASFQWNLIDNSNSPFSISCPIAAYGEVVLLSMVKKNISYTFFEYSCSF